MSRFARIVLCTAALVLCLVALPLISAGQQATTDSKGRSVTTAAPRASTPSPKVVKPGLAIPEGTVTIYSNFGSGQSYYCCSGWTESGLYSPIPYWITQGMAFTPTQGTYLLTQLDLAISWVSGTNGYTLQLRGDWEGVPDPAPPIASWKVTGLPTFGSGSGVETIKVKGLIVLLKNHRYWLVPVVHDSYQWLAWNFNDVAANGRGALSNNDGATFAPYDYSPNGAFDVLGVKLF